RLKVEGADEIEGNAAVELLERHRSVAAENALGRADAGAIDEDARGTVLFPRLGDRGGGAPRIGDVAFARDAADLAGDLARARLVDVEHGDLGAALRERRRGRPADPRSPSPDARRLASHAP